MDLIANFSTTLFDSYIETSNQYTTLNSSVDSDLNISQVGDPIATSSPAKTSAPTAKSTKQHPITTPLRVINVNFQSIKNKKTRTRPDHNIRETRYYSRHRDIPASTQR